MPSPYGSRSAATYYQHAGAPQHYVWNWEGLPPGPTRAGETRELGDLGDCAANGDYIDVTATFHKSLGATDYPVAMSMEGNHVDLGREGEVSIPQDRTLTSFKGAVEVLQSANLNIWFPVRLAGHPQQGQTLFNPNSESLLSHRGGTEAASAIGHTSVEMARKLGTLARRKKRFDRSKPTGNPWKGSWWDGL